MNRDILTKKLFSSYPEEDNQARRTLLAHCSDDEFIKIMERYQIKIDQSNEVVEKPYDVSKLKGLIDLAKTEKSKPKSSNGKSKEFKDKVLHTALDLFNLNIGEVPKLLDPIIQKVGLASLVGTSDAGKSTFLRQLALAIALKQEKFLGFTLKTKSNKVIYVSTEDDIHSISYAIRKQVLHLQKEYKDLEIKDLNNLSFIFESENLLKTLEKSVQKEHVDLIIIDAFADVFNKEINANTQVRQFLNGYDQLAKKYGLLILFLHHTGKRTHVKTPSKDNIIGSQGFEAKMRSVLELRPHNSNSSRKDLWVLKANFLEPKHKNKSYILDFGKELLFTNSGNRGTAVEGRSSDPELISKVLEYHRKGLSVRKIEEQLKGTEFEIGKSTVSKILQDNKQ